MKEIALNVIAWVICIVIGALASRGWTYYWLRFGKEYNKFTYYRIIRLRLRDRGDAPYYIRHHHTTIGRAEAVFDETWCMNATQVSQKTILEPVRITSSGSVDAIQITPTLNLDADNHPHTRYSQKVFTFSHPEPCTQLAAVGTLINGLQASENYWYATTAQYDGQTLVLVLDFTSLPYETCPISNVASRLERDQNIVPKSQIEHQWFEDRVGCDLFYLKFKNARKGDVIKFTFEIDHELIPIVTSDRAIPRPSET